MNCHDFSKKFSSTWRHSILLLTHLPVLSPSLQCFFLSSFWHKILRPSSFSLPGWVFSAHVTLTDFFLRAILLHACLCSAFNCSHSFILGYPSPSRFYSTPRLETMSYLFCMPPLFASTQMSPQTQKYLVNTCWMTKSFQYV